MFEVAYIHVGYDKTGSTAIQDMFRRCIAELRACGVVYPDTLGSGGNHWRVGSCFSEDPERYIGNMHSGRSVLGVDRIREDDAVWLQQFGDRLRGDDGRVLVLSYEGFVTLRENELREMVRWVEAYAKEVKSVVYCREPIAYAESEASQRVRMGFEWGWPAKHNYAAGIRRLVAVFGKEKVLVRKYDRPALAGGDVRVDFLVALGMDQNRAEELVQAVRGGDGSDNEALSMHAMGVAEALRELEEEKSVPDQGVCAALFQRRYDGLLGAIPGPRFRLTKEEWKRLLEDPVVRDSLVYLCEEFGVEFEPKSVREEEEEQRKVFEELKRAGVYRALAGPVFELGRLKVLNPRGEVVADCDDIFGKPGESIQLSVTISNQGREDWWTNAKWPLRGGYYWLNADGRRFGEGRFELPGGRVPRGRKVVCGVAVRLPAEPGAYELIVSLVQDGVSWFESNGEGFSPARIRVTVLPKGEGHG